MIRPSHRRRANLACAVTVLVILSLASGCVWFNRLPTPSAIAIGER